MQRGIWLSCKLKSRSHFKVMGLWGGSYDCPANSKLRSHFKVMGLFGRDMAVLQTSVLFIWEKS